MIIVIQCAGRKNCKCGYMKTRGGRRVVFVADPERAPANPGFLYQRPDDKYDSQHSWRDRLLSYNKKEKQSNPWGLCRAYQLYKHPIYAKLKKEFRGNLYILSAGWGLISADFLLPYYDITFSSQSEPYKRRRKKDAYADFHHLGQTDTKCFFCGSKAYQSLFCKLTDHINGERIVFYKSKNKSKTRPRLDGCTLNRCHSKKRNWQYDCAQALLNGDFARD